MNHTLALMKAARRWLLWKSIPQGEGKKPKKIPYYANGNLRAEGKSLDTPEDWAQLVTFDEAVAAFNAFQRRYAGIGFALGPDGTGWCWQGADLDDINNKGLGDLANEWGAGPLSEWCYKEFSPSRTGMHIISYGSPFKNLDPNGTGIEAYSSTRYFTFTGWEIPMPEHRRIHGQPFDLTSYVTDILTPRHSINGKTGRPSFVGAALETLSVRQVTELRYAIQWHDPASYDSWYRVGLALKRYGPTGWEIWVTWSQLCPEKFKATEALKKWEGFNPHTLDHRYILRHAEDRGWVNPARKEAADYQYEIERLQVIPPPYAHSAFSRQVGGIDIIPNGGIGFIGQLNQQNSGSDGAQR